MAYVIDLQKYECIDAENEKALALLIAQSCRENPLKKMLAAAAVKDFGWSASKLLSHYWIKKIEATMVRVPSFICSSEWLCAVFASGSELTLEHVMIAMAFVNKLTNIGTSAEQYVSGKATWASSPSPLKEILDILDDAVVNQSPVKVLYPYIDIPVDDLCGLHDCTYSDKITVRWA